MHELIQVLELVSRAGGGGSGGGSSGGGGGSGSIFVLIFFYPVYKISDFLRQRMELMPATVISTLIAIPYGLLPIYIAVQASDDTANNVLFGGAVISCVALGVTSGLAGIRMKLKNKIKVTRAKHMLALKNDLSWNSEALRQRVSDIFLQFQSEWSRFDVEAMRAYMHPAYFHHIELILEALQARGRRNEMRNIKIRSIDFVNLHDAPGTEGDVISALIVAKADDRLIESGSNKLLHRDTREFAEIWNFARKNSQWVLLGIDQTTEDPKSGSHHIKDFALKNSLYYSSDWGSLLLPKRGQLFRRGSFRWSDINNHVIGKYHSILFELYTYRTRTGVLARLFTFRSRQIIVAQTSLPRTYGKIVVQQRQKWWHQTKPYPHPKGLQKISMEGVAFDPMYQVFAENKEQVTSFELLDPRLMEYLLGLPYRINIEVVDNVLYLYAPAEARYYDLLVVLKWSFKNMRT